MNNSGLPNPGSPPLALAQQNAAIAALRQGEPVPKSAVRTTMNPPDSKTFESQTEAPRIVSETHVQDRRTYKAELRYQPVTGVGFTVKFLARDWSEDDSYITVEHGPHFSVVLSDLVENLTLKIGDKAWDVSWTGQAFSLPGQQIYGISFLKCAPPNKS